MRLGQLRSSRSPAAAGFAPGPGRRPRCGRTMSAGPGPAPGVPAARPPPAGAGLRRSPWTATVVLAPAGLSPPRRAGACPDRGGRDGAGPAAAGAVVGGPGLGGWRGGRGPRCRRGRRVLGVAAPPRRCARVVPARWVWPGGRAAGHGGGQQGAAVAAAADADHDRHDHPGDHAQGADHHRGHDRRDHAVADAAPERDRRHRELVALHPHLVPARLGRPERVQAMAAVAAGRVRHRRVVAGQRQLLACRGHHRHVRGQAEHRLVDRVAEAVAADRVGAGELVVDRVAARLVEPHLHRARHPYPVEAVDAGLEVADRHRDEGERHHAGDHGDGARHHEPPLRRPHPRGGGR